MSVEHVWARPGEHVVVACAECDTPMLVRVDSAAVERAAVQEFARKVRADMLGRAANLDRGTYPGAGVDASRIRIEAELIAALAGIEEER